MTDPKGNRPAKETGTAKPKKRKGRLFLRILSSSVKLIIMLIVLGGLAVGGAVTGYVSALVQSDEVRSRDTIIKAMQHNTETGFVYFQDGTIIGQLRTEEDRLPIEYSDIPRIVEDAVLSTEDEDFYKHIGVDIPALARAVKEKVLDEDSQTGGRYITQQLIRRVFQNV